MTPEQLRRHVDGQRALGSRRIVLSIRRKPKRDARHVRVLPGVRGRIVQWGDGTWDFPTMVMVDVDVVDAYLASQGV
jgi:hypothetical protein